MDNVRRLTNFSTGRLGTELANFLTSRKHEVTLLIGEQATYCGERKAQRTEVFSTTANLRERLESFSDKGIDAVFHAAAVSDYTFGKIWLRSPSGEMSEIKSGKISTRAGTLLAELVPTPKVIASLRGWFPKAKLIGWKYEVDGDRNDVIAAAQKQIRECLTDACVANGKAYGAGFGVVTADGNCAQIRDIQTLFEALGNMLRE
jgi:phosphopantothenoylcysteine synthetase/decarboxylase